MDTRFFIWPATVVISGSFTRVQRNWEWFTVRPSTLLEANTTWNRNTGSWDSQTMI